MPSRLTENLKRSATIALLAGALAACQSTTPTASSSLAQTTSIPKSGVVTYEIAGQQRLFSSIGFWMMGEPMKTQLLACFRPDGTLDAARLRQAFPTARIVEGKDVVAVALPEGNFAFFLLRDGPLVSLDTTYDKLVQQMAEKTYTPN